MSSNYLNELKVTEAELNELKGTWEVAGGQSKRKLVILRAAKLAGDVLACARDGEFYKMSPNETLSGNHCYRLNSLLELPPPQPTKREGDEPFLYTLADGTEMWCCPVFARRIHYMDVLKFKQPHARGYRLVTDAANFLEFLGCMTEDEKGWPKEWIRHCGRVNRDVGSLLAFYPEEPFHFVCFKKD